MDLRELRRIIRLVEDSAIDELEIEEAGIRVKVRKGASSGSLPARGAGVTDPGAPLPSARPPSQSLPGPAEASLPSLEIPAGPKAPYEEPAYIASPMVGTFYRSPSPDSPPFVQIGSDVQPDSVVCILEAMKVMNEIKAGCRGKIAEILVGNAQPVEFGQPLFRVLPA